MFKKGDVVRYYNSSDVGIVEGSVEHFPSHVWVNWTHGADAGETLHCDVKCHKTNLGESRRISLICLNMMVSGLSEKRLIRGTVAKGVLGVVMNISARHYRGVVSLLTTNIGGLTTFLKKFQNNYKSILDIKTFSRKIISNKVA